jgi:hypothetical protein
VRYPGLRWTNREEVATLDQGMNGGFVMHHTPFNRSAVFDPDTLKDLGETFDKAWAAIASNFTGSSREVARLKCQTDRNVDPRSASNLDPSIA